MYFLESIFLQNTNKKAKHNMLIIYIDKFLAYPKLWIFATAHTESGMKTHIINWNVWIYFPLQ